MNNSTASFTADNIGLQVGQNPGQINSQFYYNYYNQSDDSKIKGDPGKGKTMLICGIVDELSEKATQDKINIAYFFCQATNNRINSATAILQGLITMLRKQQPLLQTHIPAKFLDNENRFLEEESSDYQHVKWIVSSRNWPSIEKYLDNTTEIRLHLELNEDNLAAGVDYFIKNKVEALSRKHEYSKATRKAIEDHLVLNAKGTFLWVALVCEQLKDVPPEYIQAELATFPPGLGMLYQRMLANINKLKYDAKHCTSLLGIVATVYRPITLDKLSCYLKLPNSSTSDIESDDKCLIKYLERIARNCGSFLALRGHTIALIHQSAQDFLLKEASQEIAPKGVRKIHYFIFSRSLQALHKTLRRNIYELDDPAITTDQITQPDTDPLQSIRYACIYWVDHLKDYTRDEIPSKETGEQLRGTSLERIFFHRKPFHLLHNFCRLKSFFEKAILILIFGKEQLRKKIPAGRLMAGLQGVTLPMTIYRTFIQHLGASSLLRGLFKTAISVRSLRSRLFRREEKRKQSQSLVHTTLLEDFFCQDFLYWLEALTLLGNLAEGATAMLKLERLIETKEEYEVLHKRIRDAYRFIIYHKPMIEDYPLQVYTSAIFFSPRSSITRTQFESEELRWMNARSMIGESWSACLQTLEGHGGWVQSVVFSHDSKLLASASHDNTVKLWNAASGACLQIFKGHSGSVHGASLQTLKNHSGWIQSVVFSHDSKLLASASDDKTIRLWITVSSACLQTLKGHGSWVQSVVFSHDSKLLASASRDETTLKDHSSLVQSVVFSHNSKLLASASYDKTVKLWDAASGTCLQTLKGHSSWVQSVVFSHNSKLLASASHDKTVKLWNAVSGACLQTLKGHSGWVQSVDFSHDSKLLASASRDETALEGHSGSVQSVVISHNFKLLASASRDNTVKLWDAASGACLQTLKGHNGWVQSVVFSHKSKLLASTSYDKTVKL
ncbi:WD40 repeat domain-containing protein [Aspergillus brunneoviolaceus CBS 621.78]|uniref:WD40 repeat-like protein n=1 Tax=Aspergillus brunneoviolaceus CBS 621.78 TaxID=1450534 RepID=A0ACD1FUJ6_9EURO|nr:WD40 repeat-like protein [Aspergillus brunneoviolaceus CBS 621.78]RAH40629.1 WD40 repeat-like protein [Aspergillus brunneoviolaceus CBS 621.78]